MNKYVKIIKKNGRYYSTAEYSPWIMYLLGNFFTIDVGDSIKYWLESLNEPNHGLFHAGGNWAVLEKDEKGVIYVIDVTTSITYEENPIPEEMILRIKPDELIKLLYKWEELYDRKVPEIMITKDGDNFEMFEIKPQTK